MKRHILVGAALLLAVAAAPASAAGKGGDSIQPDCWWDPAVSEGCDATAGTLATVAGPQVKNKITFNFETRYYDADGGTGPWMQIKCYRAGADYEYEGQLSGVLILSASRAGFPGGWGYGVPFSLESASWTLGPADCVTDLGHKARSGRFVVDASTNFSVSG